MAIEVVEEFEMKGRAGGIGGFNRDDSDNLEDMRPEELLVINPKFLTLLSKLKVAKEETVEGKKKVIGGTITLGKEDIPGFELDQGLNGACHMINKVFVALQVPFYAKSYSTDEAKTVTKVGKKGKKKDVSYTVKEPDGIRIYRVSEEFDIDNYAAEGSIKVQDTEKTDGTIEKGSGKYQEPTEGMRLRAAKWISQNGEDIEDVLEAIGITTE